MGIKVCKFGGTSLATATNILKVKDIINAEESRKFVVVSAPGKRYPEDIKITDLLYQSAKAAREEGSCKKVFALIKERFITIATELKVDLDIESVLAKTEEQIDLYKTDDFAASRGEYLNAIIISKALGFPFVDAAEVVKFDTEGKLDLEYTNDQLRRVLKKLKCAVVPGFYGKMPDETIKTFSRGGSDITGSLVARAVNAEVYENWTDVNGFMTADPRLIKNPKTIKSLGYHELRELSYMGASVLHAEAIFPVKMCGIPINIKNTFEPENPGTMIIPDEEYNGNGQIVTGIAGKKNFSIIHIEKSMMNSIIGFGRKILSVLERYGVSFEHIPSGIDTLSFAIESKALENGIKEKIITRIREAVEPDAISVTDNISLIATVGYGMCNVIGTSSRLFSAIGKKGINIVMIDQGSSEMNIIVGVSNDDYERTIEAIYNEFIGKEN
ncbi:MAG: aspartate kinase [Clostridia bacterium]|nr:aspartate kinase [Clostridia bacterium]